ncbi:hypothetical protein [Bartonella sp. A05]|uniref:hypothetical protein n=1 Tax=Bartonella sp. A05 TaxID=2967261 RepID=UPI0022A8F6DF|nr:hypothetical protein [Bartonella sp. A05]MCZ2204007.1 hypothetical protein [Bartonella sp. A05]
MKLTIHTKWYSKQVTEMMTMLQAPRLHWALRNAVNDTAKQVERFTEQKVSKVASVQAKRVKKGVYVNTKATVDHLEADIRGSATLLPLKFFKARETKRGVVYTLFGRREIMPHGFIQGGKFPERVDLKMGGNVFQIVDGDRFPIAKQTGTSIASVMSKSEVSNAIEHYAHERLATNIRRQLARQKYAAKKKAKSCF